MQVIGCVLKGLHSLLSFHIGNHTRADESSRGAQEEDCRMEEEGTLPGGPLLRFSWRTRGPEIPSMQAISALLHGQGTDALGWLTCGPVCPSSCDSHVQSNMLRLNEIMHGVRPQPPFREWNAGRLREVFLSPMYPCPYERKLGSPERGKVCPGPLSRGPRPPSPASSPLPACKAA